jgi:hypothetical protein
MPHGFFTVEQWKPRESGERASWVPILHLDSYQSLTTTVAALEKHGRPGLYRILQTQRCIWAEMDRGKLRMHGSHVSSPDGLARLAGLYESQDGRRPVEKARRERVQAKRDRAKK